MAEIILDIGSGNTCKNDIEYAIRMVDEVIKIDTGKHKVVFKAQLFTNRPPNVPLTPLLFSALHDHCKSRGYKLTASIFDLESLQFLLAHNPCFVKIANDRSLDWLIGEVPRKVRVIRSVSTDDDYDEDIPGIEALWCCSKYPALASDYPPYPVHISDHTIG